MEFNLADLFEAAVDAFAEREYLVAGGERRTYAEMEARANQLATTSQRTASDRVTMSASTRTTGRVGRDRMGGLQAPSDLDQHQLPLRRRRAALLFANANLKALVHQREFSLQVAALLPELPGIGHVLVIDDGTDHPDPTHRLSATRTR